jgi:hypothetical protein
VHRPSLGPSVRRVVVYTHRWLGIILGLLFITWFVSGVVLMYAGMPRLSHSERLAQRPPLSFATATLAPAEALARVGRVHSVELTMVGGRPVYLARGDHQTFAAFADTGASVAPVGAERALAEARTFAPGQSATLRYETRLVSPDQWTLELARQLPMHRVALGDADRSQVYISEETGDVLLKTTQSSRTWAYPGAILHWIYLTPIRRHSDAWAQLIIWTSVAGTIMSVVGFFWGLWRYSPRGTYRLKRVASRSPYAGWMWWHHYAGLIFGITTVTWIFSGLLSMDPWNWHPSTVATPQQQAAFSGGNYSIDRVSLESLQDALGAAPGAREARIIQSQSELSLSTDRGIVPLTSSAGQVRFDESTVRTLAATAMPSAHVMEVHHLDVYDSYYSDRDGELPLPVYQIKYDDPSRTWLYVDALRGIAVRKEERLTRLNRWLYRGLHDLDFPPLYDHRPLWDIVVIGLSLGGLALAVASVAPALHRIRRNIGRRRI